MGEKKQRKKRLKKQIEGLEKQKEKHLKKIKIGEFSKDTTPEYWKKEMGQFEKEKQRKEELLKKLSKK